MRRAFGFAGLMLVMFAVDLSGCGAGTGGTGGSGGAGGGSAGGGSAGGGTAGGAGGGSAGGAGGGTGVPRLVGLTWSGPYDGGVEQLRQLDPATGNTTLIAALPGIEWLTGVHTADPARGVIYVVAASNADPQLRLFTINAASGAIEANPVIDGAGTYNWSGGIHLRSDGGLIGMTWRGQSDAGAEEVRTINPATGATTFVSTVPGIDWLSGGVNAGDPVRNVIYAVAFSNSDARERLYSIGSAGQVLANPVLDGGSPQVFPLALFTRASGQLVALSSRGTGDAGMQLRAVDSTTGWMQQISAISSGGISFGAHTIDRAVDQIYVIDDQNRLLRIDAATGAVLSSPTIVGSGTANPFYWSGLHLIR